MVRLTDRPDMTLDVYSGRKTTMQQQQQSAMVLGGIAHGVKSHLIVIEGNMTAVRYRDEILRPIAVPLLQQRQLILQQDNARPYLAIVCRDFLVQNNIVLLDWPPYSHRAFVGRSA